MGNIRATSDPSQGKVHVHDGTGLKGLVYYPFGNTRTPFSSSSSHPHLLPPLDLALPPLPSPHHRPAWPATCPVVHLHNPPCDEHLGLGEPVVRLSQEVEGGVAAIVPATPQQLGACPRAGERLVWPHPISRPR